MLIELARVLKERKEKPKCNIWLYWIDAEESARRLAAPSRRLLLACEESLSKCVCLPARPCPSTPHPCRGSNIISGCSTAL